MQAHGHQRVLEWSPGAHVRVHVPGGNARHAEPRRDSLEAPVAGAIVAQERALQLDPEAIGSERIEQAPERELVVHPPQRATAQADQPLGVVQDVRKLYVCLGGWPRLIPGVAVRERQDPAEAGPATGILDQQRQMPAVGEVDLGAVDRAQPERPRGDRELHRARDRVVVGQGNRFVAQLERGGDDLVGQRGAVQEREGRMTVELDVRH